MLTFPNITPAVFEAVLNELRQSSTVTKLATPVLTIPEWLIEGNGIRARVAHLPDGLVQVLVEAKPFYVSDTMIGSRIRNAIDAAQARIARQGGAG